MSKIAILTDSSCDIPQELAEKYGIDIMGFHIQQDVEAHDVNAVFFGHLLRDIAGGIGQDRDLAHNFPHFHW